MTLFRATAVVRRGSGTQEVQGYAFHMALVWFFVPDLGSPGVGERVTVALEGKRGPSPSARVLKRTVVEALQQMLEGL